MCQEVPGDLVTFPAHALIVVEERLKDHQAEGILDPDADVTRLALRVLLLADRLASSDDGDDPGREEGLARAQEELPDVPGSRDVRGSLPGTPRRDDWSGDPPVETEELRQLERMEPRIPEHLKAEFDRDLAESKADLRRTEENLKTFARRASPR